MDPRIQIPDPHRNVMDPQHCLYGSPRRRRPPVLQVRKYLTHEACLSTSSRVHVGYGPFTFTTSGQRKNPTHSPEKSHPPTGKIPSTHRKNPTHPPHGEELLETTFRQRGGRSPNIVLTPSFPSFAPYAPQWLIAIGICPFFLIPDNSLYVTSVLLYP